MIKLLLITPSARAFGLTWRNALRTGLLLGPGGEFAFVIISVALAEGLLPPEAANVVLFATALTMAIIPLLSKLGDRVSPRLPAITVDPSLLKPDRSDVLFPAQRHTATIDDILTG